jgi:membrane peptidoglycan carboxypeptidase
VPGGLLRFLGLCALAGVLLAGVIAPISIGLGEASNQLSDSVDSISSDLASAEFPLVTTMTDRNGTPIAYLYEQYRLPVSFSQISPNMTSAIIAIEDKRFYDHAGIDIKSALRAAVSNSSGGSTQGASTITQQYVKNFLINVVDRNNPAAQAQDQAQTVVRKLREAKMAMSLDQQWSKNNILTGYLNVVQFGHSGIGPYGVRAAAAAFFNTTPDKLTVPQSALLAGLVNNPVLYDPYKYPKQALDRRNLVIQRMVENGALTPAAAKTAKAAPLGVVQGGLNIPSRTCIDAPDYAGFLCEYAVTYLEQAGFTEDQIFTGGYTIKTTLDPTISQAAKQAADDRVPTTQYGVANTFDIVKPGATSHEVLALVANRNLGQDASQGQTMTNLPAAVSDTFGAGSTFKIFTTAAALELGQIGLNSVLPNPNSTCFTFARPPVKPYCLKNAEAVNIDPLQLPQALAISPNTLFVNVELHAGMSNVLNMAYRLGLRHSLDDNTSAGDPNTPANKARGGDFAKSQMQVFQGQPSFTLGVAALSPLEEANVIATLGSGGVWCPATPILSVSDRYGKPVPVNQQPCEQVVPTALANTLLNGLSHDTVSPGTSAQPAAAAHWTRPIAGKTGTTEENKSLAFVGLTDGYAASSIVFADGSKPAKICFASPPHLDGSGGRCGSNGFGGPVAAPTFFNAFNQILANTPDTPIPAPDPAYMNPGSRGPTVPYVVGATGDNATNALKAAGYQVTVVPFNSATAAGTVIGQTPQGNQVPAGTAITLYVSTGSLPPPQGSAPPPSIAPGAINGG